MQTQSSLKREFLKKWVIGIKKCTSLKEEMSLNQRKKVIKLSADLAMASTRKTKRTWSRALIAKASSDQEIGSLANRILNSDLDQPNLSPQRPSISTTTTTITTVKSSSCNKITRTLRDQEIGSLECQMLDLGSNLPNLVPQQGATNTATTTATTTTSSTYETMRSNIDSRKKCRVTRKIHKGKSYGPRKLGALSSNCPKIRAMSIMKRLVRKRTQILKGLIPGGEGMDECCLIKEALDYIVSLRAQVDVMHHLASSSRLL